MGGLLLPEVGFNEPAYRREFLAVLTRGMADMMSAGDAEAFYSAYGSLDKELKEITDGFAPPEHVAQEMRKVVQKVVESIVATSGLDLAPLNEESTRRVCMQILNGMKSGNPLRIDRLYEDMVALLVKNGEFTYGEARGLVAELSLLESRNLKDLLDKVGRSERPSNLKFLRFAEENGNEKAAEAAKRAREELLSTISKPPAKLLRLPDRVRPQPLRRIRNR